MRTDQIILQNGWQKEIPNEEWRVYREVIEEAYRRDLRFLIGGAFSLAGYTGHWRNTKDLDFFILPADRAAFVQMTLDMGFKDYYDELQYEQHWIYRALRDNVLVDLIWAMANRRTQVDEEWFENAPTLNIHESDIRILPPEELIWAKLYVLQKDRCDWTDLFNVLYSVGPQINWARLIRRLGSDAPLLAGLLRVFGWLCPERAGDLPEEVRNYLHLPPPPSGPPQTQSLPRAGLLDSRPWFPLEELDESETNGT